MIQLDRYLILSALVYLLTFVYGINFILTGFGLGLAWDPIFLLLVVFMILPIPLIYLHWKDPESGIKRFLMSASVILAALFTFIFIFPLS